MKYHLPGINGIPEYIVYLSKEERKKNGYNKKRNSCNTRKNNRANQHFNYPIRTKKKKKMKELYLFKIILTKKKMKRKMY